MSDPIKGDIIQINNLSPSVVKTEGAGKAYQSVAQSMALAVQDATDYLRNISTIASTAVAVATEMMIANPEELGQYIEIINKAQDTVNKAATTFQKIGTDAGQVLEDFPSGSD
ncbi:hypothetical protein [Aphanothece sacrum]|uniref:Uncharacterized protein n=1 Tax=Aphanothece sacrum FPU1 TaxID=1920663 RepID=A0A401ILI7_APHSA|nr:hypothetical protein [Aphanothece sacrum]GBF82097.1 hypothetical protein AsFPU1_3523 [Aphanothece sacrum FPU1]GBF85031.1 serine/threonine protein kinase [Aphanothece sacrum FPU3]